MKGRRIGAGVVNGGKACGTDGSLKIRGWRAVNRQGVKLASDALMYAESIVSLAASLLFADVRSFMAALPLFRMTSGYSCESQTVFSPASTEKNRRPQVVHNPSLRFRPFVAECS
jgi:hypothetical protein